MMAARRPRSAALLVGSTSAVVANVHSAGQSVSRFIRERAHVSLPHPGRAPLEQLVHLLFDRLDVTSDVEVEAVGLDLVDRHEADLDAAPPIRVLAKVVGLEEILVATAGNHAIT